MKYLALLFFYVMMGKPGSSQICHPQLFFAAEDGQCNNNPYVLVFEDHFDGDSLDLTKWQIQPWAQGSLAGDNTQQYYSLDNVSVSSGICSITAKRDTVVRRAVSWLPDSAILSDSLPNLRTYFLTSSNIWTYDKFRHGIFEIRCRIPEGKGFWPAFWMYGSDSAGSSEIDVFEFWNDNTTTHHMTAHYDGQMCASDYDGPDYASEFHTFKIIWNEYKIEWYVDSVLKRTLTKFNSILGQNVDCDGVVESTPYILEKTFPDDSVYIITNLAIQTGTWAPDTNTTFPASLEIDYIRYYRQLPATGTGSIPAEDNITLKTYPNPNSGELFIEFEGSPSDDYDIYILDEQGEIVYKSASGADNSIRIDISGFSRGVYVVHILDNRNKREFTRKVIFN
jgi:beta-glucanase (GH16 family)